MWWGTQSKNYAKMLNELATNSTMETIVDCVGSISQRQKFIVQDIKGNVVVKKKINLDQGSSIDMSCVTSATKQDQIASAVASSIAQFAKTEGQGMLSALGNTTADVSADLKNKFKNKITAKTANELHLAIEGTQDIEYQHIEGTLVIEDEVNESQNSKVVASALMKTNAYSSVINSAANKLQQVADAKDDNFVATIVDSLGNAITNIISSPMKMLALVVLGLLILLLVVSKAFPNLHFKDIFKKMLMIP